MNIGLNMARAGVTSRNKPLRHRTTPYETANKASSDAHLAYRDGHALPKKLLIPSRPLCLSFRILSMNSPFRPHPNFRLKLQAFHAAFVQFCVLVV